MNFDKLDLYYQCVHLIYLIFVQPNRAYRNTYKKELYRILHSLDKKQK